jgi:hypothetical protein
MSTFHTQPLLQQATVGELLRRTREQEKKNISVASRTVGVREEYLVALEQGRYNDLPSPVYIKNYLKRYAEYLGLPWAQVERLYTQEIKVYHDTPMKPFARRRLQTPKERRNVAAAHHRSALLIPRALKFGIIGFGVLLLVTYFVWGLVRFLSPPTLSVTSPAEDMIVTDYRFSIEGRSQQGAIITINGQEIVLDPEGKFSEPVILNDGLNTIQVEARTRRSRERSITRYVLYQEEGEENTTTN